MGKNALAYFAKKESAMREKSFTNCDTLHQQSFMFSSSLAVGENALAYCKKRISDERKSFTNCDN